MGNVKVFANVYWDFRQMFAMEGKQERRSHVVAWTEENEIGAQ